jgi:hypothetical protein
VAATPAVEAPDSAEAADGSTSRPQARSWTSSGLSGPGAAAQLQKLAASLAPGHQSIAVANADRGAQSGGSSAPGSPGAPSGPPCNAGGIAGTAGGGALSGGWAAIPARALGCAPAHELRPNRLPTFIWRPAVFLSLQERPG